MARYKAYDLNQTKMIPRSYADQIVAGSFEHALSEIVEEQLDLTGGADATAARAPVLLALVANEHELALEYLHFLGVFRLARHLRQVTAAVRRHGRPRRGRVR